jgi:pantetheine-phosphate adenylyltransferase
MSNRKAIVPGSYDPITVGHMQLIINAAQMFDEVIVAVGVNVSKKTWFTIEERTSMVQEYVNAIKKIYLFDNIIVDINPGLTAEYATKNNCRYIVRGLRNSADYTYEEQIAAVNRLMFPNIQTVCLLTDSVVSSSAARELAMFEQDLSKFVPKSIEEALKQRAKELKGQT